MCLQSACIKGCIVTLVAIVALFFTVYFQTFPKIACQRGCIVTLVAYVRLFPTVYHQMSSQTTCLRRCKVTLVAFVCFFSIVYFQMSPQITCWRGCKVTLVAFFWLFSTVRFQMCPQIACPRECIVALAAFVLTFLRCVFSNESSNGLPQIFQTSPQIIYLRKGIFTLVAMTFLSTVEYYVYLQIACMKRSIVTLTAIVMLFFCCVFANQR